MQQTEKTKEKRTLINFAVANARSIELKMNSMFDLFDNFDMSAVLITETWIKTDKNFNRIREEIISSKGLDIISYNRPGKRNGGGVAIVFDPKKLKLSEHRFRRDGIEMVAAKGRIVGDTRTILIYNVYLPPNLPLTKVRNAREIINNDITKLKTEIEGPLVLIGGDFCLLYTSDAADE